MSNMPVETKRLLNSKEEATKCITAEPNASLTFSLPSISTLDQGDLEEALLIHTYSFSNWKKDMQKRQESHGSHCALSSPPSLPLSTLLLL